MAAGSLANQPPVSNKPACTADNHGQFWPDAANSDHTVADKLSRCGALEICSGHGRKYQWKLVAVNIRQLGKTPQEPTPECAAIAAEYGASQR